MLSHQTQHYFLVAFTCLIILLMQACTKEQAEPFPEPENLPCDEEVIDVSFSIEVQPILATYCYPAVSAGSCHDGGDAAPGDFRSYGGVADRADQIMQRVFNDRNMPPSYSQGPKSLEFCDSEALRVWLDEGALNN